MERIREVLAAQDRYWRFYGGPSEEDHSLNNMNRDLIEAMNGHYGQVYVGSIMVILFWYNTIAKKSTTLLTTSVCLNMMQN